MINWISIKIEVQSKCICIKYLSISIYNSFSVNNDYNFDLVYRFSIFSFFKFRPSIIIVLFWEITFWFWYNISTGFNFFQVIFNLKYNLQFLRFRIFDFSTKIDFIRLEKDLKTGFQLGNKYDILFIQNNIFIKYDFYGENIPW